MHGHSTGMPWQGLHGGQPRAGSRKSRDSQGPVQGQWGNPVSRGTLPGSLGANIFSEDKPLLTSVEDEAGTEVCAQMLDEKRYASTRGQQEAAENNRL